MACLGHMLEAQATKNRLVDTGHYCTCICFKCRTAHRCWIPNGNGKPESCCKNV